MVKVLTEFDIVFRLVLGFIAGAVIGFERSSRRQVAGLRTHILIALGATLLMLLSIWLPQTFTDTKNGDPGRIAAQVVSGIGFLGAGAIIRLGNNVRGLTTAASLWFVAAVGLAIGGGMFIAAATAEALSLVTLILLGMLEKRVFPTERYKLLEISYKNNSPNTRETLSLIKAAGIQVQSTDVNQGSKDKGTKLRLLARIPNTVDLASLAREIKSSGNVGKVEIKEKY
jgi:putative Mg2+ transporter-C (MgtC) family protein